MNRLVAFAVIFSAVLGAAPRLALAAGRAPSKPAGGERQQPDSKAMMERNKRCLREVSAQASKVTFDRKDVEKYLAEYRSFDALHVDEPKEELDGPRCVELGDLLKDRKYVAWARERRLDPKDWLLKSLRISLTHTKRRAPEQAAEMKKAMEGQRREMAKHCKSMGPDACREMEKGFAQGEEMMRENAAMMALFPEPTRAEAGLLAEYDARLREAMEGQPGGREARRGGAGPGPESADVPADENPSENEEPQR